MQKLKAYIVDNFKQEAASKAAVPSIVQESTRCGAWASL